MEGTPLSGPGEMLVESWLWNALGVAGNGVAFRILGEKNVGNRMEVLYEKHRIVNVTINSAFKRETTNGALSLAANAGHHFMYIIIDDQMAICHRLWALVSRCG